MINKNTIAYIIINIILIDTINSTNHSNDTYYTVLFVTPWFPLATCVPGTQLIYVNGT